MLNDKKKSLSNIYVALLLATPEPGIRQIGQTRIELLNAELLANHAVSRCRIGQWVATEHYMHIALGCIDRLEKMLFQVRTMPMTDVDKFASNSIQAHNSPLF